MVYGEVCLLTTHKPSHLLVYGGSCIYEVSSHPGWLNVIGGSYEVMPRVLPM